MSDNWITIIPRDPYFIPTPSAIAGAEAYLEKIILTADEMTSEISDGVRFRDCGGNFQNIHCPVCSAEISTSWWSKKMSEDWDRKFALRPITTPCSHAVLSLNELRYDWDQGFSCFALDIMNPDTGPLDPSQIARIEQLLGCPLKIIYRHI